MQVWWRHQLLSMEPWAGAKKPLCKCGCASSSCPWSHGRRPKKLYASVVVPPAPVHGAIGRGQKTLCKCGGATSSCPCSHGLRPKKLYASVEVPPVAVHGAMCWGQKMLHATVVLPLAPVHGAMGRDEKSFMLVRWCHQLLSMEPWAATKKALC